MDDIAGLFGFGGSIDYGTLETLNIHLGNAADTFTIQSTHSQATNLNTRGGVDTINVRNIAGVTTVNGGDGVDTIIVGTTAPTAGGTANGIAAHLKINGNGHTGAGDTLNVDDFGDGAGDTGGMTATRITGIFGAGGSITYTTLETLKIDLGTAGDTFTMDGTHGGPTTVNAGTGEDTININGSTGTLTVNGQEDNDTFNVRAIGGPVTINAGGGDDTINVGSSIGANFPNVNGIAALLTINGQGGGATGDTLNVDETGETVGNTGELTNNEVTLLGMGGKIVYGTIETLNISLGSGGDTFTIQSTHSADTNVNAGSGQDLIVINGTSGTLVVNGENGDDIVTVNATGASSTTTLNGQSDRDIFNIKAISGPVTIKGGNDDDTVNVGSNASGTVTNRNNNQNGTVDNIKALLKVDGDAPSASDILNIDDTGDASGDTGQLTSTRITGLFGAGGSITYGTVETLNIDLGTGDDKFRILSTHAGQTNLNTGPGIDEINVGSNAPAANGDVNAIVGPVDIDGDTEFDTLTVDDTGDPNANTGVLTLNTLTGLGMGSGITYAGLEAIEISLGSGGNTFRIDSTHEGTTLLNAGTVADTINVRTIDGDTTINGETGGDTINVGSTAPVHGGIVDGIRAVLTLNLGEDGDGNDFDQVNVDDSDDENDNDGRLTLNRITGLDMADGDYIDYFDAEDLNIDLGRGHDTFTIESTHTGTTKLDTGPGNDTIYVQTIAGETTINTQSGDDTINVGDTVDNVDAGDDYNTTDQISALLKIDGGTPPVGSDILNIFDSGDTTDNIGFLTDDGTTTSITGLDMSNGIEYVDIEELNVFLGSGDDIFNVSGTGSETWIYAGSGDDAVNINRIEDETVVFGQTGDDRFHVAVTIDQASGFLVDVDVNAEDPLIDPRNTGTGANEISPVNIARNSQNLIHAELTIDGRDGGDQYTIWLASSGAALINVFDTGAVGGDFLTVFGSDGDDLFLMRAGFGSKDLSAPYQPDTPAQVTASRADLVPGDLAAFGTARVGLVALLNNGRQSTAADVERVNYSRNIELNSGINGNLIVQGVGGRDEFYVDDNLAPTQLFGGSTANYFQFGQLYHSPRADNIFAGIADIADEFQTVETTRGFLSNGNSFDLTAIGAVNGPNEFVVLNNQATLNLLGGDDDDMFTIRSFAQVGSVDSSRRGVDISTGGGTNQIEYVVGAPINIDGGGGFNTLKVIGTEFGDDYVVTENGIFGAGRTVNFVNIQQLEIDAAEGNDRFFIVSTSPETSVILSGGLGSDVFFVGGDAPDIISRDLLGHSGIISHGVGSDDASFDGTKVNEISANVGDDDEAGIVITQSEGDTVVVDGVRSDSYTVVLTRQPSADVTVTASAPRGLVRDASGRVELRPTAQLFDFEIGTYADTVELVFTPGNWDTPQTVWIQAATGQPHTGITNGFISHDVAGDRVPGTTTQALRVVGQDPNRLVDTSANFGGNDSLRGATVVITEGPGKGLTRNVIGNTDTTLILDKPWFLDEVSAGSAGSAANQSDYEVRLYEGLAIPVVSVKVYFPDAGAAIIAPGGILSVIEQPEGAGYAFGARTRFEDSYQVVLTERPGPAESVTVTIDTGSSGLRANQASLTFDENNWDQPQTVRVAIGSDDIVEKTELLEIEHSIAGEAMESLFVRVTDGDSSNVVVTETAGSTSVIEDSLSRTDIPRADAYEIVLSRRPTSNVEIVVRAEGTRTSKGRVVNFGEQVEVATNASGFSNTITLVFTPDNWDQAQTVRVKALNDGVVDGGDTKVFPRLADDTSRIQGPLRIQGGGGQGSLVGLPIPVLLPGETNEFLPSGAIQAPEAAGSSSAVVSADDLSVFMIKYGLTFGQEAGAGTFDAVVGKTLRILDGRNATEFDDRFGPQPDESLPETFNPANPVHQRLVPFREILGATDLLNGTVRLTFNLSWNFAMTAGDEFALINSSPANFFAVEDDQVDLMLVLDSDARSDEEGRLIFHTENDPNVDIPMANRGQLIGLGMHDGRTLGEGAGAKRLPAGIVFDEIEMLDITLGGGKDHFVIDGTHSGATRVNGGGGNDVIEVLGISGVTTVNGGPGDNTTTVGDPTTDGRTLSRIAALLSVGGDIPSAIARTTVRGEPDVFAPGGGLIAAGSTNEQEILINAGGGTFTIRFKGVVTDPDALPPAGVESAPINHDADAATIKQALIDVGGLTDADFEVVRFGGRIVIRFTETGQFAKKPMHVLGTGSGNLLQGGTNTLNVIGTADALNTWAVLTESTLTGMGTTVHNSIQTVFVDDPQQRQGEDDLRKFKLIYDSVETSELDYSSTAAEMEAALELLPSIGDGNVSVSKVDNVFIIRFQGDLTNRNLELSAITTRAEDTHVFVGVREPGIDKLDPTIFPPSAETQARNDVQTVRIDATGGTFRLEVAGAWTGDVAYNATADEVRDALQRLVGSQFADDVSVVRFATTYQVMFQGLLRQVMGGVGTGLMKVDTSNLTGTAVITTRMDGINYYYIDELNIEFGSGSDVLNVQSTSAEETNIALHDGNDRIFISSDADLDRNTLAPDGAAYAFDFLTGNVDGIVGDLNIDAGDGRHIMMISDESTELTKGTEDDPVTIQRTAARPDVEIEILGLNFVGGAIRYGAAPAGNFFDGITLWGGQNGNEFDIDATHRRDDATWRTQTTLNTGDGADTVSVSLTAAADGFFVLNTQGDGDDIDARTSTLPMVIFGGEDSDTIFGGQGGDIIFGDLGRVVYRDEIGDVSTVLGHGGTFDSNNGRKLPAYAIFTVNPLVGDVDNITAGNGSDVIVGGFAGDTIYANEGNNTVVADTAWIEIDFGLSHTTLPDGHASAVPLRVESVLDTTDLQRAWTDFDLPIDPFTPADLIVAIDGDTIESGSGNDLIAGGLGDDRITVDGGANTVLGDNGVITFQEGTRILSSVDSTYLTRSGGAFIQGGNDTITTGIGSDIVIAGLGDDTIDASDGDNAVLGDDNIVIGDEGRITYQLGSGLRDRIESLYLNEDGFSALNADDAEVGDDTISTGDGHDVIIGGLGGLTIEGEVTIAAGDGDNIVIADEGFIQYQQYQDQDDTDMTSVLWEVSSLYLDNTAEGDTDLDTFVQGGNETITTGTGSDIIIAGLGNDTIDASDGDNAVLGDDNIVIGDEGRITYQLGSGLRDRIESLYLNEDGFSALNADDAEVGDDTISTGDGHDVIIGGLGGLTIEGEVTIAAGDGDNIVIADEGFIQYQDQDDTDMTSVLWEVSSLYLDNTAEGDDDLDTFVQGGNETITTGEGDDIVIASLGNDDVKAGNGDNVVLGDEGSVMFQTGSGFLHGIWSESLNEAGQAPQEADDASVGNDTITTGSGRDYVLFGSGDNSVVTGAGDDIVLADGHIDFHAGTNLPAVLHTVFLDGNNVLLPPTNNVLDGGEDQDILIGGSGHDWIEAGSGDDIVIGDEVRISFDQGRAEDGFVVADFIQTVFFTPLAPVGLGDQPVGQLIPGGIDAILGQEGDDILAGGSLDDVIDGGTERDQVFGDNVTLDRQGRLDNNSNQRFRALTGDEIYATELNQNGDLLIDRTDVDGEYGDPDWAGNAPFWADFVVTGHDGLTTPGLVDLVQNDANRTYGSDILAGGSNDDMIFGQRGEDTIQGDGSVFFDVWKVNVDSSVGGFVAETLNQSTFEPLNVDGFAPVGLFDAFTLRPAAPDYLPASSEAATDGDDYIEGGVDTDVIFGDLGQNDIIGGSSNQFGLDFAWQRAGLSLTAFAASGRPVDGSGADILFGGAGLRIDHNNPGFDSDDSLVSFEDRHARNANVIVGDNGNIFRLTGTGGFDTGANLTFNYDAQATTMPRMSPVATCASKHAVWTCSITSAGRSPPQPVSRFLRTWALTVRSARAT